MESLPRVARASSLTRRYHVFSQRPPGPHWQRYCWGSRRSIFFAHSFQRGAQMTIFSLDSQPSVAASFVGVLRRRRSTFRTTVWLAPKPNCCASYGSEYHICLLLQRKREVGRYCLRVAACPIQSSCAVAPGRPTLPRLNWLMMLKITRVGSNQSATAGCSCCRLEMELLHSSA